MNFSMKKKVSSPKTVVAGCPLITILLLTLAFTNIRAMAADLGQSPARRQPHRRSHSNPLCGPYKVFKNLVRLGAYHFLAINHESWNCGNTTESGILPVLVHCFLESLLSQGLFHQLAIKANCPGDLFQD